FEPAAAPTYAGVVVAATDFELTYTNEWIHNEPTAEMLASIEEGQRFIDVCVVRDGAVVEQGEFQLRRALDQAGANGKFDGEDEEFIASTEAYADACVAELGDIPFFPRVEDGDFGTFNCLEATPLPTTVTDLDGNVRMPSEEVEVCDNPQYIYSSCEANAERGVTNGPRVTTARNDEGTEWVLLCRKAKEEEGEYNDIAMLGHNPVTGKTCFFQNALYSRTDGTAIPHPGDRRDSETSPETSPTLWSGIHGGLGSGIECASCHDSDPFIHTPWIDQAKREDGTTVVPKMGEHEGFVLGSNDAPYALINQHGQNWTMPQQLVSEEAAACTNCHRIGDGRWTEDWIDRLDGTDEDWAAITTESHQNFEDVFWMPPELDGVTEETWDESAFGLAMEFIRGCADDPTTCDWAPLPTGESEVDNGLPVVDLEGDELALEALKTIGADVQDASCENGECATRRCAECHPVSRPNLMAWSQLTSHALTSCSLQQDRNPADMTREEALQAVHCMRVDPDDDTSVFAAERLGILTTGVQFSYFRNLFRRAYGADWEQEYTQFSRRVSMPKGNHPRFSLMEYAVVLKWFNADLEGLDNVLEEEPPPEECVEEFDFPRLAAHIDDMRFEGWGAVNADNGIRMFGCPTDATDARECFGSGAFADRSASFGGDVGTIRELSTLDFNTSFWTRTSADGRFVGNGGGNGGATITDLQTGDDIGVDALYDPGFFPDNSGFIFQGAPGGAGLCTQRLLESGDRFIDFSESECMSTNGLNLYQHVARGLGGGDYFVINSQFTSDPGGGSQDPWASFGANATMKLTPMIFNGTTYEPLDPIVVDSPYEGDSVLSPSSGLVVSRLAGPGGTGLGYVVREVDATPIEDTYVVDTGRKLATVCTPGAKANVSFDERFMVTHHYEHGTANVYLVDLSDGARYAVTDMPSGSRALFPHFVSNGWIYFLVHDTDGSERIAASDAAIRVALGDIGGGGGDEWEGLQASGTVARDEEQHFSTGAVPAGRYTFQMSGDGDADLYLRAGAAPTADDWDCRPYSAGSDETCSATLDAPGEVHVMVRGYATSSNFELRGEAE
ncbi:MAG: PPC domain-containing protein, partial [Myxococcota bacterium]